MKTISIAFLISIFFNFVNAQIVVLGSKLPDTSLIDFAKSKLIQTAHSQLTTVYPFTENGLEYLFAVDKNDIVVLLATMDTNFVTLKRYKIGVKCKSVSSTDILRRTEIYKLGNVITLKSGWSFLVEYKHHNADIQYFFKQ